MSKHASVLAGVLILIATLGYVRALGVKSNFEYVILRTLMALAGAYGAAGLLGAIEVTSKAVKASGGFAVAALLFVVNPIGGVAVASAPPEKKRDIGVVDSLLRVPDHASDHRTDAAVDSISKRLGFRDYEHLRVLGSPRVVADLKNETLIYRRQAGAL